MDTYSSGEELVIKIRKPYTITKQRERWTEEEHNRFLEALKLYGRAWQRIEEHIGTKTAVQIRSHAQKFFSKLEKEALAKGVPISQALDIEIPPPRPKRKPSNPYPRKTGVANTVKEGDKDGKSEMPISSLHCKQVLDLEKEPLPERPNGDEKAANLKEKQDESCSEVLTRPHEANCSSASSMNKNFIPTSAADINSCMFREFVPSLKEEEQPDPKDSEALQGQHSQSKSPTLSSSDCEERGDAKVNTGVKATDDEKAAKVTEPPDANKTNNKKQVDRSSCGSNTGSSSEVETDVLEKHEKDKEDLNGADANPAQVECNRRSRSSSNPNDSWKGVSEEGRQAFQALFSREILPQSFSPLQKGKNKGQQMENAGEDKQNPVEKNGETSTLDLNSNTLGSSSDHQEVEKNTLSRDENTAEEGLLTIGLGHSKLKANRTGFKPYKRCSVEAEESRVMNNGNQGEEKGPKRVRLEGEAST